MNKELLDSMNKQMTPSPQVRAELSEKLARPVKKRPVPWKKYGAAAACAALVIGGFSAYSLRQDLEAWTLITRGFRHDVQVQNLHSYVTVEGMTDYVQETATTAAGGSEGGDRDMGMTPEDLTAAMLDVGYTQEEIDEYQSIGYQMTWAKWWKFVGEQQNSEGDDPFNLDVLKTFSQKELYVNTGALPAPNTGDLPGGAFIGDVPVQEGAEDYQKLMDRFNGTYPDWYGGAYLDSSGWLVVQLVEDQDPGDKSLELQVLDWTGSDTVMFSSCKYSLSYLRNLQDRVCDAMIDLGLFSACGTDEERNRLDLILTDVTDRALAILAGLDPDDDAIYVQVGQRAVADVGAEEPAVSHVVPGGATVPEDDGNLIAAEPWYDGVRDDIRDLPEDMKPSATDSVPEEEDPERPVHGPSSSFTPAYDPDKGFIYPKK